MALHQHFVILSLPRTGSTYLVDYLDAAPNVKCLSEVFNPDVVLLRHHQPNDTTLTDKTVRDNDPLRFLYRLEQDVGPCESFGVKLFPDPQPEAAALFLRQPSLEEDIPLARQHPRAIHLVPARFGEIRERKLGARR